MSCHKKSRYAQAWSEPAERQETPVIGIGRQVVGRSTAAASFPVLALGALPLILRQLLESQVQADQMKAAGAAVAEHQGRVLRVVGFVAFGALEGVSLHSGPGRVVLTSYFGSCRHRDLEYK